MPQITQRTRLLLMMSMIEAHTATAMEGPMMSSGSRAQKIGVMAMMRCRIPGRNFPGCALLKVLLANKTMKSSEQSPLHLGAADD